MKPTAVPELALTNVRIHLKGKRHISAQTHLPGRFR